jgi:phosphoglycolate phosphatase
MSASHEEDYQRRVETVKETTFLPDSKVEIIREIDLKETPEYAVFDFDGTVSLVREGWPDVMIPMLLEELVSTGTTESEEELTKLVTHFVNELTGKQTVYQMIRLCDEMKKRGGTPKDPMVYKKQYTDLLQIRIQSRHDTLKDGSLDPRELLVPHSYECLQGLQDRGVKLYLASGTDEEFVKHEADLLGLTKYFGEHIYGAVDDYKSFSKKMVIDRILKENKVEGSRLIGMGDGYVEIDNIKEAGGTAIAVATDESNKNGEVDQWKRDRLIGVGADVVIPDFQDCETLFKYIWKEE